MWGEEWVVEASLPQFWGAIALLVGGVAYGLFLFIRSAHRARTLVDLPIANVRSAAQGYTRLEGRARALAGDPIVAPLSGKACVWYRFEVEQRQRDPEHDPLIGGWESVERGTSDAIFGLDDGTGLCVIDPDGADVIPSVVVKWRGREPRPGYVPSSTRGGGLYRPTGPYRYTECRIDDGASLDVAGEFQTLRGDPLPDRDEEVRDLLSRWKRDRVRLLQRFDENRDGSVDLTEWELAQQRAEQEVAASSPDAGDMGPVHLMRRPRDGKALYLYGTLAAESVRRQRRVALVGAVGFIAALVVLAWALQLRFGD